MKISKEYQKRMFAALAKMREEAACIERQREEKMWSRCIDRPFHLQDLLSGLTKFELDSIRQKLEIPGISSLKKMRSFGDGSGLELTYDISAG